MSNKLLDCIPELSSSLRSALNDRLLVYADEEHHGDGLALLISIAIVSAARDQGYDSSVSGALHMFTSRFIDAMCPDEIVAADAKLAFKEAHHTKNNSLKKPPFAKGDRIRLISMGTDPYPVEPGTLGTVEECLWLPGFNQHQVHVKWDGGRTLAMVVPPDLAIRQETP